VAVVADDGAPGGQHGHQRVPVVSAEDQIEAAVQPDPDKGLRAAVGGVAPVADGQRGELTRFVRFLEVGEGIESVQPR